MISMSMGKLFEFSRQPVGVFFRYVSDGKGEDGRIAVRVDCEDFFFDLYIMLFGSFAKKDHFIRLLNPVFFRRPKIERVHARNEIDASDEAFFK